jgi:hypothetical protein
MPEKDGITIESRWTSIGNPEPDKGDTASLVWVKSAGIQLSAPIDIGNMKVTALLTFNPRNDRPSTRLLSSSATPVLDWI